MNCTHLRVGDALVLDAGEHLLGRELRVARPVGHVERPDGVGGVREERNLDGHESSSEFRVPSPTSERGDPLLHEEMLTCVRGMPV